MLYLINKWGRSSAGLPRALNDNLQNLEGTFYFVCLVIKGQENEGSSLFGSSWYPPAN